jgi:hypothetical protein
MAKSSDTEKLDGERLLREWRWLCPQSLTIIDRNAFGDLFLTDEGGRVHMLDVGSGKFVLIAESVANFTALAKTPEKQESWFAQEAANAAAERGLIPGPAQCIGFSTPVVFAESKGLNSAYVDDLYEHVGFLGDIHRQVAALPDGAKVRVVIKRQDQNPDSGFGRITGKLEHSGRLQ